MYKENINNHKQLNFWPKQAHSCSILILWMDTKFLARLCQRKRKVMGGKKLKKVFLTQNPILEKKEREKKNASLKRAKVGTWKHQILFFHPLTTTMLTCGVWVYVWDCVPTKVFIPHWRPLRAGGVSVSTNGM